MTTLTTFTCPGCRNLIRTKRTAEELNKATADCPRCESTLLFEDGKVSLLNETLHEENKAWPKDGVGARVLTTLQPFAVFRVRG